MMLSEFAERTGVTPTAEEYARIEAEYYEFDGDKDAFCRAWKRANPASVRKAEERKKHQERMSKVFSLLVRLDKWKGAHRAFHTPAMNVLKDSDYKLLYSVFFLNTRRAKTDELYSVFDLRYDLQAFFKNSTERV